MKRIALLLLCAAQISSSIASPQLDQIKLNAKAVSEQFGPASELARFGCNTESVAYLDGFISRQAATINKDLQSRDRFISLFGSFLGECILSTYGGTWVETPNGIHIEVSANGQTNIIQPFQKVAKRIQFGESESLIGYFRDLLPQALGHTGLAGAAKQ